MDTHRQDHPARRADRSTDAGRRRKVGGSALAYWALQLLGWGFYYFAQTSGEVIFASQPWSKAKTLWGGATLGSIALTHLLRWAIHRYRWLSLPPAALLGRVIVATLAIGTGSYLLTLALSQAVYGTAVPPLTAAFYHRLSAGGQLRNLYILILLVHIAWVALYLAFATMRHRHQSELRLLKSQLNPHFLFNALNGLRSLIADEPARAREGVTQLARMLRYTLASGDDDMVSLDRELEMVDDYLALESLRLEDRLKVEREIDPAAQSARVPTMLLQTLVENAIKHGIAQLREGGTLRILARVDGNKLLLRVENPRPPDVETTHEGVGLQNAAGRLRLLFGVRASLRLDLSQPGRATAEVRLPA
jgi:anti-sigma regulatory factor (Ser/Thr protein kinase)